MKTVLPSLLLDAPSLAAAEALLEESAAKLRTNLREALRIALRAEDTTRKVLKEGGFRADVEARNWPNCPRPWLSVLGRALRLQMSAKGYLSDTEGIEPLRELAESILLYMGNDEELASLHICLGVIAYDRSDFGQSLRHYAQARHWADQLDDSHYRAVVHQNEGNVWAELGEYARAIDSYEAARAAINRSGSPNTPRILASILMNLGAVYQDYRRCDFARVVFREALQAEEAVNDPLIRSKILASLGVLEKLEKRYPSSCDFLHSALALKETVGDRAGAVYCLLALATGRRLNREFAECARLLERATDGAMEINHQRWLCSAYLERGLLFSEESWEGKDLAKALEWAEAAAKIAEKIDNKDMLCQACKIQADVLSRSDRHKEAFTALQRSNDHRIAFSEEEAERKLASMRVLHEVKDAREEAARARQRNDELARLLEEKDAFLGIAAHDLKNPLSAIIGLVRELRHTDTPPDELERGLEEVEESASHMLAIVRNLLDLNRYESGEIEPDWAECDLAAVIYFAADSNGSAAEAKGINLDFHFPPEEVLYRADAVMIRQIVDNLVSNAIKFSPRNTRVEVSLARTRQGYRFCVKDEGPGIAYEDQARIFDRFFRTGNMPTGGEHSTGLGLAIVKRLAILQGALVTLESEPGAGAAFSVLFPVDT